MRKGNTPLPVQLLLFPSEGLTCADVLAPVERDVAVQVLAEYYGHQHFDPNGAEFWDLTQSVSSGLDGEDLREISVMELAFRPEPHRSRKAILVDNGTLEITGKYYGLLLEGQVPTRVFVDRREAFAWLGKKDPLEHPDLPAIAIV
ncbi:MAG: hypothetical protein AAF555_07260 [Verrucomicrobiota bacterium]